MAKSLKYQKLIDEAFEQLKFDEEKLGIEPSREHIAELLDSMDVDIEYRRDMEEELFWGTK